MDAIELLDLIQKGESSTVQFKVRVKDASDIGKEMVAFSNTDGGLIVVGIDDKTGDINGLSYEEIQSTNDILSNAATNSVKPQIYIKTATITIGKDNVVVATIPIGTSIPYTNNDGIIFVKNGSDKRKVVAKEEIARLLQSGGNYYVDEIPVNGTTVNDIDEKLFLDFFIKNGGETPEELDLTFAQALQNTDSIKEDKLTLGGLLFFGKEPQKFRPAFCIKAVAYYGSDIEGTEYRDSEDIKGTIPQMFDKAMAFLKRNLKKTQQGQDFNSEGILEVAEISLEEILQNALIHREYLINAPIRLFIFDNRIEIISPGKLPNSLTVEKIKLGSFIVRNNLLVRFCSKTMKYRGIGSGIRRAIKEFPHTELINDTEREFFVAKLWRTL